LFSTLAPFSLSHPRIVSQTRCPWRPLIGRNSAGQRNAHLRISETATPRIAEGHRTPSKCAKGTTMFCSFRAGVPRMRRSLRVCISVAAFSVLSCSGGESFKSDSSPRHSGALNATASVNSIECPKITSYTVSPYKNAAGSDVAITSTTDTSMGVWPVFRWAASSGSFVDIEHEDTTYHCGSEPNPTITLTVTYGSCLDQVSILELDCT